MTKIGQLTTEKSIELAVKEIKEWLSMIEINGLDVDIRYDAKTNVAMLRFKYGGREYEFIWYRRKRETKYQNQIKEEILLLLELDILLTQEDINL